MFKLNKSTHMMILTTFTLVFVVVYMYYTIKDVKKMYSEVKKNTQDIQALQSLVKEVKDVKNAVDVVSQQVMNSMTPPQPQIMVQHHPHFGVPPEMFVQQHQMSVMVEKLGEVCDVKAAAPCGNNGDDDVESVSTEDIKKLIDTGDEAEETGETAETEETGETGESNMTQQQSTPSTLESPFDGLSEDVLKKRKFDEIKDICKKMGLSAKGTREALISRILTEKNIS